MLNNYQDGYMTEKIHEWKHCLGEKKMKGTNHLEHRSWLRSVGVIPCHMKGLGGNAYDYGS